MHKVNTQCMDVYIQSNSRIEYRVWINLRGSTLAFADKANGCVKDLFIIVYRKDVNEIYPL